MKPALVFLSAFVFMLSVFAQSPKSATVPITLDHSRVIIDVYLPLPDGTSKRVRAWVDTGNPEMTMSQRTAARFGAVNCDQQECTAKPPSAILVGGLKLSLPDVHEVHTPARVPDDFMNPGMSPEINLPSWVLHNYDVVIDYPNRQLTIAEPGSVQFKGSATKALISSSGLIQVPSKIEGQDYNLALDVGASITVVSGNLLGSWQKVNPKWETMHGAVGAANMWGMPEEAQWDMVRLPRILFGSTQLDSVAVAPFSGDRFEYFTKRAGVPTIGLVGGNALRQFVVGIDYANSTVYLQRTGAPAPDMDVVGLTLRPEVDGRFTVLGVVDINGKPAVPDVKPGDVLLGVDGAPATGATMGQVWSLLGGLPGQTRSLTLERDGKRFTVDATVRRFLATWPMAVKSLRRNPHRRN